MNIIEAFHAGKRVRRKGWADYHWPSDLLHGNNLLVGAILADDWEVEEAKVTINRSILSAVWKRAKERTTYTIEYHGLGSATYIPDVDLEDLVAEELGL